MWIFLGIQLIKSPMKSRNYKRKVPVVTGNLKPTAFKVIKEKKKKKKKKKQKNKIGIN